MVENGNLGFAEALTGEGKYPEAIQYMQTFLKKNPGASNTPNIVYKIGDVYRDNLKKPDSASAYFEKVLNFPDNALYSGAAYLAGKQYEILGKDDKAISSYMKVMDHRAKLLGLYAPVMVQGPDGTALRVLATPHPAGGLIMAIEDGLSLLAVADVAAAGAAAAGPNFSAAASVS